MKPNILLIIHTDRGTQFTTKEYRDFVEKYNDLFEPSMSRKGVPTDNAVMERFNQTFKSHKHGNLTFEERLTGEFTNDFEFKGYARLFSRYILSINQKANRKTKPESPLIKDKKLSYVNFFMLEPDHPKAFSKHVTDDFRLPLVENYIAEANDLANDLSITMDEYIQSASELVDLTPFDSANLNSLVKLIDKRHNDLLELVKENPNIIKNYVEESLNPIQDTLEDIRKDIQTLLPKRKKKREIKKLRDPLDFELFPIFLKNAGTNTKRLKRLRAAQLRVCYTILFYTGLRINETAVLTHQDFIDVFETSQLTVTHFKQKQSHVHVLSKRALRDLALIQDDIEFIFVKNKFKFLFGKTKPMHEKSLIRFINRDLKHTCHTKNIAYNIKSHSFRIYVIASLLRVTSVQNVADVIGHNDIRSTMKYSRYALNKREIQNLFEQLPDINSNL